MRFQSYLIFAVVFVFLWFSICEGQRGRSKGTRRRGKGTRKGTSKFLFYTNPKRKDYYDNPDGASIIKSSHFDYEFFLGHKIVFICVAKGDPLPSITWSKDNVECDTHNHPFLKISEWILENNQTKIKSKLEIDPARQMDSGNYECMANNKYNVDRRNFKADFMS